MDTEWDDDIVDRAELLCTRQNQMETKKHHTPISTEPNIYNDYDYTAVALHGNLFLCKLDCDAVIANFYLQLKCING